MTTTQSIETETIVTLAANLYCTARKLAEQPFVGGGVEISEFVLTLAENSRIDLHLFLCLHLATLVEIDSDWDEIFTASATEESWDAYGA